MLGKSFVDDGESWFENWVLWLLFVYVFWWLVLVYCYCLWFDVWFGCGDCWWIGFCVGCFSVCVGVEFDDGFVVGVGVVLCFYFLWFVGGGVYCWWSDGDVSGLLCGEGNERLNF